MFAPLLKEKLSEKWKMFYLLVNFRNSNPLAEEVLCTIGTPIVAKSTREFHDSSTVEELDMSLIFLLIKA